MLRCLLVNSLRGFHFRFRSISLLFPQARRKSLEWWRYWRHADGIDSLVQKDRLGGALAANLKQVDHESMNDSTHEVLSPTGQPATQPSRGGVRTIQSDTRARNLTTQFVGLHVLGRSLSKAKPLHSVLW